MEAEGAYILGCAGLALSAEERRFFAEAQPWGFILFARNVDTPGQLQALTAALREAVGRRAPIFIDQEGGRVARLTPPHWRAWLPALEQVRQNPKAAVRALWLRYRIIAHELRAVGIDGNCAPLGDIASATTHPVLRNRCYGEDVVHVAERASAVAQALLDGGVLPVVKHLPGQGRARLDSHAACPHVTARLRTLRGSDFLAFEPLAELPLGMTAHVVYEALDATRPATLSPDVLGYLRHEIGFHGLLMSDDISMGALGGPLERRAREALDAGCDVVLHCNGELGEMREIAEACGPLRPESRQRAAQALAWRRAPTAIDIAALDAEFQALMTGQGGNG